MNTQPAKEPMKLGLYFAVCETMMDRDPFDNDESFREILDVVASHGYQAIELSAHTKMSERTGYFELNQMLTNGNAKTTAEIIRQAGLEISAINMSADGQLILGPHHADTDGVFQGTAEEKIEYGTRRMMRSAELASELDIDVVTGFTGCEDYSRWFPWPDPEAWGKMEPVFVERWLPILDRFKQLGVRFAMECHPRQLVYNTETAVRSLELVEGHPSWGFNLDPANLMLAGVDPVVFAAELGDRVFNVHAKDGEVVQHNVRRSGLLAHGAWERPDRGFRFRVAGWGDVPWRRLITELLLQGYEGPLVAEHEDPTMGPMDGIRQAAEFLSPLMIQEPFPGRWW